MSRPAHGNRRYVKLAGIAAAAGLVVASPAQAETVTTKADQGVLAIAADGTPYVAWLQGRDLYVSLRSNRTGRWTEVRAGRMPSAGAVLAGIRVSDRPHRFVSVLVEHREGRWIALARGSRITTVATAAKGSSFGPAGLALDAREQPAVAYAVHRETGKTFLRLVTFDRAGRARARGITREGFPASQLPPGAAPLLVGGKLHVVETYTSSAIDWYPKPGGGWEGQFLWTSRTAWPQGRVGASYVAPTLWAAWTQVFPGPAPDDITVLLTSSAETQETSTLTHGIFVALAQLPGAPEPEVGAYDWIRLGEDWFEYAGLVISGRKSAEWQLDGRLEGLAIGRRGSHQLLLAREQGLEWFRAPALPGVAIHAGRVDADGTMSGAVVGATGGTVEVYRELPHAPRELAASAPLQADGSFHVTGLSSDPNAVYRLVYTDPATGIPFGFLPGIPVGVGG